MTGGTMQYDYEGLWRRQTRRFKKLIAIGEAQAAELEAVKAELARVDAERNMLARRAAEMAHELIKLKYPKQQAA